MIHFFKKTLAVMSLILCTFGLFAKGSKDNGSDSQASMPEHTFDSSFFSMTKIEYPVFENEPVLNEFIYETVKKAQKEFVSDNKIKAGETAALEFHISYKTIYQNDKYISFSLRCYTYTTGAAHGITTLIPISYDVHEKKILSLEDILPLPLTESLAILSAESEKQLMTLIKNGKISSNEEWVKNGTAPSIENFKNFEVRENEIKIVFEQYQVAPYSAGILEVIIPFVLFK